jgi:phospholipid/cholesterol/gamma-HCH transport system substrate-binding protein
VSLIEFDRRPGAGDGVLVTLALDPRYRLSAGVTPRLSRALIGDVSIDLIPGTGPSGGDLVMSKTPAESMLDDRILKGAVAPDPALALEAATRAFEEAGGALAAIQQAAQGMSKLSGKAENLDQFLDTWTQTGKRLGTLSDRLDRVVADNQGQVQPALDNLRAAAAKFNATFDEATQKDIKTSARNLADGSARLDRVLADLGPVAAEIGGTRAGPPTTSLGQTLQRLNKITYEIGLLSAALTDPSGRKLNPNGTLQRILTQPELYDNLNRAALGMQETMSSARPVFRSLGEFAERVARDPSVITRGVLQSR